MAYKFEDYVKPISGGPGGFNDVELPWAARGILWWLRAQGQPVQVRDILNARDGVGTSEMQDLLTRLFENGYISVKSGYVMSPEEKGRVAELERTVQYLQSDFVQKSLGDAAKRGADDMIRTLRDRIEAIRRGEAA